MRLTSLFGVALAGASVTGLVACGDEGVSDQAANEASVEVPAFVQELIDADFPADGEIHEQSVGEIMILPDTSVCYSPDGFAVDSSKLFGALGQKKNVLSGSRLRPALDGQCSFGGDTVLMKGFRSDNREGTPYRLTLAVWQGNAAWIGSVERQVGKLHPRYQPHDYSEEPEFLDTKPRAPPSMDERLEFAVSSSIHLDASDLSGRFIENISKGKAKKS